MATDLWAKQAWEDYVARWAPVLALELDPAGLVLDWNATAAMWLPAAMRGRPLVEALAQPQPEQTWAALTAGGAEPHRLHLATATGWPETFLFCFYPRAGGWLALGASDRTDLPAIRQEVLRINQELSNLTRQLHQANADLQELNQQKSQFLGMAAHDLRRLVEAISLYNRFVLDEAGAALSEEQRGFLRTSLRSAATMSRLIDDYLDVAMIESGGLRLQRSVVPLAELLVAVRELGHLLAAQQGVTLVIHAQEELRPVQVDAEKFQQVLLNLIGNACEHSPRGQRVSMTLRWAGATLVVAVRDEGEGLTAEAKERLFRPFGAARPPCSPQARHWGLGLAIAHQIVTAHGGKIEVESAVGWGACFTVHWPPPPAPPGPAELV